MAHNDTAMTIIVKVLSRDGEETEPSKNEQNQNTGFTKNRTEPYPVWYGIVEFNVPLDTV